MAELSHASGDSKVLPMKNPPAENLVMQTDRFLIGCGLAVFALAAIWAVCFVPMNMDEAGIFHIFACSNYPFASFNTFRDACVGQNDLTTFFGLRISRPEWYTGIWHSILYAPFYFVFHAPIAQYGFGLCFLFGFAGLMGRAMAKPLLGFAITLAFVPFVFHFVHDLGPVKFALLCYPLSGILLAQILKAPSPLRYGYAVGLAFLIMAGIEEKAFFLYLLIPVGFFALALAAGDRGFGELKAALYNARWALVLAALVVVAGVLILFFSENDRGQSYIVWLADMVDNRRSFSGRIDLLFDFFFYWPAFAHTYFDMNDDTASAILFKAATAVFCAIVAWFAAKSGFFSTLKARHTLLGLSFLSTTVIFIGAQNVWAGHHFIFMWAPLILLFMDFAATLAPMLAIILIGGFFAFNLASLAALTQGTFLGTNAPERAAIFHYFDNDEIASHAIINFSSWGAYYIQAIYGPKNQLVTYTEPHDLETLRRVSFMPQDAAALLEIAHQTGRRIYNICYGPTCTKEGLESVYDNKIAFEEVLPGLQFWHVFAATPRR